MRISISRLPILKRTFFLLFFFPSFLLIAQTKTAHAVRVTSAPIIDGSLDDAVWQKAVPIKDFKQQEPIAGSQPSFQTEARIVYDDDYFYVGVMCYDNEPDKIIARELKWDGRIGSDDNVKLLLDTFNDNRSAYWFGTNPLGAQDDALLTGFEMKDFNEAWNAVWDVECKILNNGWSAEFRFPFSTFKFYNK
ncbi:MAG: carbohydrate binding family 9 domain-containing protein [Melioribacteraceae bacterium]